MAIKCKACVHWLPPSQLVEGLCTECRRRLGLPPQVTSAIHEPEPCALCGCDELVEAILRHRAGDGRVEPTGATYPMSSVANVFSDFTLAVDSTGAVGVLVALVCRACGHTQLFAEKPREIPIGPEYGTRLRKAKPRSPYRG